MSQTAHATPNVTQDQSDAITYLRSRADELGMKFVFDDERMLQALDEYMDQARAQNTEYASYLNAASYMWQEMKPKMLLKRHHAKLARNAHNN